MVGGCAPGGGGSVGRCLRRREGVPCVGRRGMSKEREPLACTDAGWRLSTVGNFCSSAFMPWSCVVTSV